MGCGTGTNVVWLVRQGFSAIGVDVSSVAIERARASAAGTGLDCRFERLDFLTDAVEPVLEILELRSVDLGITGESVAGRPPPCLKRRW